MAARRKKSSSQSKARREFVSESEEILEQMREDLSQLADQRTSESEVDPELVNRLFRCAHSLKGLSGMFGFDAMSDVSKELRAALAKRYTLERPEIVTEQVSVDGTRKWLLRLPKLGTEAQAPEVETVYIPEADRGTLCISSQVGCTLTCTFCHTGTQRLVRNLTTQEIVGQILLARDRIGDWPGATSPGDGQLLPATERKITNIVLMGMGEPLYNFDNVKEAMDVAADGEGLSVSKRRITLSTSGIVPEIGRWGAEAGTMLAISLHATRDEHDVGDLALGCR